MSKKRRRFTAEFKARVALDALSGEHTLSELASKYGVHTNQISTWKKQAKEGIVASFSGKTEKSQQSDETHIKELHAKIGQLTIEKDFLQQAEEGPTKWTLFWMNFYAYVQNNPVNYYDPIGLASLLLHVNPRGSGSNSSSNSSLGHVWVTLIDDNGTSSTIGNYPGGPRDDSNRAPTSSRSWEISQKQADAALTAVKKPGYNFLWDNCTYQGEDALDAAGIGHPNFNTFLISAPEKVSTWLDGQSHAYGRIDTSRPMPTIKKGNNHATLSA